MMELDESILELIELTNTSVVNQAVEYLSATPFEELQPETQQTLYEKLLQKDCFEPLYNLSLICAPNNLDLLMKKCIKSDSACKILMNLTRTQPHICTQIFQHNSFEQLLGTDHEYMFAAVLNISKSKETHGLLIQYLPNWDCHPFIIGIMKNLAFNCDMHPAILDILPLYLGNLAVDGFHENIINDDRVLDDLEKDEISDFILNLKDVEVKEAPQDLVQLLILLLSGSESNRQKMSHLGLYYLLRHLDNYATLKKWDDLNDTILKCVELLINEREE
eukprot:NODE_428_length_7645_cov_0.433740.p5 type:complete len:277 gc:universal NODE_428_length_7645_cov_0.433740:3021-3851(+)